MATVTQATKKALRADADPAGPRGCTNFKLRQLTRRVSQHCEPYFAASGLKTTQYALLSHIDLLGPVQPSQLARRMGLDTSTLSRNLQPLLAGDWVERLPGGDARSSQVR
ncbi:MAG TPA: MarR family winged helix-turn-helix transcriptional regulator, partial [Roseateles sp.]|nr:MarR family winged helix-turn-helix transcriptional regulator [Roseateles sp.]